MTKILLIDSSPNVLEPLSKCLKQKTNSPFKIDWTEWSDDTINRIKDYDLFVVGGFLNGGKKTLEILHLLSRYVHSNYIFVASDSEDLTFYKALVNYRVKGYIDTKSLDVRCFVDSFVECDCVKDRLQQMSAKLDRIVSAY